MESDLEINFTSDTPVKILLRNNNFDLSEDTIDPSQGIQIKQLENYAVPIFKGQRTIKDRFITEVSGNCTINGTKHWFTFEYPCGG